VRTKPPVMSPIAAQSCRSPAVRWFSPEDARDHARLDAWCAGVGPPVVHNVDATYASTADRSPVALADVTFVTWNVHVGNGDINAFVADLQAGVLTDGKPVREFVLMVQEAVRGGNVPAYAAGASGARRIMPKSAGPSDIVEVADHLGLSLIYVPSMRNGNSGHLTPADRGSAILSTMRLLDPVAVELPGERQRRVAIFATLEMPSRRASPISVGVVHLDPLGAPRRLWLFGTPLIRELQVKALAPLFPDHDLVLGADLNTWHGSHEAAARYLTKMFGTRVSMLGGRPGIRVLDYLFFRLPPNVAAECRVVGNAYGSDHLPLIGQLGVGSSP
jgi:endonuclease/exonuclease/phosphatase family metal-dependent hydrolase